MEKIFKLIMAIISFFKKGMETIISLLKIAYERNFSPNLNSFNEDKNYVVLVNGPSLKDDYKALKEEYSKHEIFVVNQFCHSEIFDDLKPINYLLLDGLYFLDKIENELIQNTLIILQNTEWKINLYIPRRYRKSMFINEVKKNKNINLIYFNSTLIKGGFDSINHRLFDKRLGMPQAQNVLVAVLFNLVNLGAKNIFIFGAQNDWHKHSIVGKDNRIYMTDYQFYKKKKTVALKKSIYDDSPIRMHEFLMNSAKALMGYHSIKKYSDYKKANIFNCSSNSFIDAFPRLDHNEFLDKVK
jgi:hypothetical protein